jgi:Tfp pilus assembly protein PilF
MGMVENLEKMLAKGRDDAMLRFGLGSAYFNEGNFSLAVTHLEACLAQDDSYSAAYKLLGKAYLKEGEPGKAISTFEAGMPIAEGQGDKQSQKEMRVFLGKAQKEMGND